MEEQLVTFHDDLKKLRRDIDGVNNLRISRKPLREEAERLGTLWFKEICPTLREHLQLNEDVKNAYNEASRRLVQLSAPNNRKSSYLEALDAIIKSFRKEVILPLKTAEAPSTSSSAFDTFLESVSDSSEGEYFREAINCAKSGFIRAAAVMNWCSAIDKIHRRLEASGFPTFNITAAQMASQQKGRYKRFNKSFAIASISELREVFDTDVLWVIEGMGLIDSNQHTRLRSCFDMRNHAAHPGDAPITLFNLMSMFSDISEIVLKNPQFQVEPQTSENETDG